MCRTISGMHESFFDADSPFVIHEDKASGRVPERFRFHGGAMNTKKKTNIWIPITAFAALLIFWQLIVAVKKIPMYVLPTPIDTVKALINNRMMIFRHAKVTVFEALAGMGISFLLSILLGILMDCMSVVKQALYPILVVTQTVPMIVLSPILIIYLGFGMAPKLVTVVLMCFFPIVVSFTDGMAQVNEGYVSLVRSYGASKLQVYTLVKIPASVPSLISGLKVAATYSISGAVVGEWVASKEGLGYYLIRVKNSYELDKVFASVLVIILLSLMMNGIVQMLSYAVQPYQRRKRKTAS